MLLLSSVNYFATTHVYIHYATIKLVLPVAALDDFLLAKVCFVLLTTFLEGEEKM